MPRWSGPVDVPWPEGFGVGSCCSFPRVWGLVLCLWHVTWPLQGHLGTWSCPLHMDSWNEHRWCLVKVEHQNICCWCKCPQRHLILLEICNCWFRMGPNNTGSGSMLQNQPSIIQDYFTNAASWTFLAALANFVRKMSEDLPLLDAADSSPATLTFH